MSKDIGHARMQQQSIKHTKKISVGLSKNTEMKEKEKTNNSGNCETFLRYMQTKKR